MHEIRHQLSSRIFTYSQLEIAHEHFQQKNNKIKTLSSTQQQLFNRL